MTQIIPKKEIIHKKNIEFILREIESGFSGTIFEINKITSIADVHYNNLGEIIKFSRYPADRTLNERKARLEIDVTYKYSRNLFFYLAKFFGYEKTWKIVKTSFENEDNEDRKSDILNAVYAVNKMSKKERQEYLKYLKSEK